MFYLICIIILALLSLSAGWFSVVLGRAAKTATNDAARKENLQARIIARAACAVFAAVAVLLLAVGGARTIETGKVGVVKVFGRIQPDALGDGLRFVNPVANLVEVSVLRHIYEIGTKDANDEGNISITRDKVPLIVDVGFPVSLNPSGAVHVVSRYGSDFEKTLLIPSARSALRAAVLQYDWADAAIGRNEDFKRTLGETFETLLRRDLVESGFDDAEAKAAFSVYQPQVRKMLPPKRITDATSEKQAAVIDLDRQVTLTDIARQEAERRANEGMGVAKMFSQLPTGFTTDQIIGVLGAVSDKTRADAMMRAVELNNIDVIVVPGSTPPAISIPTTQASPPPAGKVASK